MPGMAQAAQAMMEARNAAAAALHADAHADPAAEAAPADGAGGGDAAAAAEAIADPELRAIGAQRAVSPAFLSRTASRGLRM